MTQRSVPSFGLSTVGRRLKFAAAAAPAVPAARAAQYQQDQALPALSSTRSSSGSVPEGARGSQVLLQEDTTCLMLSRLSPKVTVSKLLKLGHRLHSCRFWSLRRGAAIQQGLRMLYTK